MFTELDLKPPVKKLKSFAWGMTTVSLLAIPILIYWLEARNTSLEKNILICGAAAALFFVASRFTFPQVLKPIYIFWVGLSVVIGMVVGPIVLTLTYFGVVTPVGLVSRMTGKKWITTGSDTDYWVSMETHKADSFELQF